MKNILSHTFRTVFWAALAGFICYTPLRAQMTPELKDFLERQNFRQLIEKYKKDDRVSLYTPGRRQETIARQPYTVTPGYRVQVFAGNEEANARKIAAQMEALKLDSVYVVHTPQGLYKYKVQIGNFRERKGALILLDKLKRAGIRDGWVVDASIHAPKSPQEIAVIRQKQIEAGKPERGFFYTIQLFATRDEAKAKQVQSRYAAQLNRDVQIIPRPPYWKVTAGRYDNREAALKQLREIRRIAADAWVTQVFVQ